jgi:hypothetical protein
MLQGGELPGYAHRLVTEHLALGLVHDRPDSVAEMPLDQFAAWGVSIDEAFQIAEENLENISPRPFDRIGAGVFVSPYRDNHDASRIILKDQIRSLRVRGSPVVMVPNRDTLIITGADDPDGLLLMARITEQALDEPRPMTGIPAWLDEDTWRPFVPDEDHPLFVRFGRLRVMSLASDYAAQKELLEALNEKNDEDVFVATFTVVEHTETGHLKSYSTWAREVPTILPRTDDVMFIDTDTPGEPEVIRVSWERAEGAFKHLMEALDMYPPRYRVNEFPTRQEIDALRE